MPNAERTDAERLESLRQALEYAKSQKDLFSMAGAMVGLGGELPWVFALAKKAVDAGLTAERE